MTCPRCAGPAPGVAVVRLRPGASGPALAAAVRSAHRALRHGPVVVECPDAETWGPGPRLVLERLQRLVARPWCGCRPPGGPGAQAEGVEEDDLARRSIGRSTSHQLSEAAPRVSTAATAPPRTGTCGRSHSVSG